MRLANVRILATAVVGALACVGTVAVPAQAATVVQRDLSVVENWSGNVTAYGAKLPARLTTTFRSATPTVIAAEDKEAEYEFFVLVGDEWKLRDTVSGRDIVNVDLRSALKLNDAGAYTYKVTSPGYESETSGLKFSATESAAGTITLAKLTTTISGWPSGPVYVAKGKKAKARTITVVAGFFGKVYLERKSGKKWSTVSWDYTEEGPGRTKVYLEFPKVSADGEYRVRVAPTIYSTGATTTSHNVLISNTKATVKLSKAKQKRGAKAVSKLAIKTSNAATGKAAVYIGGKKVATVKIKKSKGTYKFSKKLKLGTHKVKVKFTPTNKKLKASTSKTVKLKVVK